MPIRPYKKIPTKAPPIAPSMEAIKSITIRALAQKGFSHSGQCFLPLRPAFIHEIGYVFKPPVDALK